ncbi:hypothetical protein PXH59_05125 [Xenorhabdus sp. SF857]|uniref:hypothetical protein n=1 Tax=Xenorhabdus bakwenae TaxID=3026967 RepID=UPI0025583306|nr:hypothetical protein [Xenorhabdus sp. SF857]WFQ80518.1 hypothetical protein PXH59_05125 [Xenorhabdus sp. SF857]
MTIIAVNETRNATTNAQFYDDTQTIASDSVLPEGKVLVDAEAYWRLRKDLKAVEKIVAELLNRMRFIHDGNSIAEHDYPIHEVFLR